MKIKTTAKQSPLLMERGGTHASRNSGGTLTKITLSSGLIASIMSSNIVVTCISHYDIPCSDHWVAYCSDLYRGLLKYSGHSCDRPIR